MSNGNIHRGFYSPRPGTAAHDINWELGGLDIAGVGTVGGSPILTRRYAMGAPAAGDTLSNFTGETPFASALTLPPNDMIPGRVYTLSAAGVYGINAAGPRLTFFAKLGATTLVTDGVVFGATARSNRPWRLDVIVTVLTAGPTGTVHAHGSGRLFVAANAEVEFELFNAVAVVVDTTVAQRFGVNAQFNIAATANTVSQLQNVVLAA